MMMAAQPQQAQPGKGGGYNRQGSVASGTSIQSRLQDKNAYQSQAPPEFRDRGLAQVGTAAQREVLQRTLQTKPPEVLSDENEKEKSEFVRTKDFLQSQKVNAAMRNEFEENRR